MQNMERILPPVVNLESTLDLFIEIILIITLALTPFLFGSVDAFGVTITELGTFLILFLWLVKALKKGFLEFVNIPVNKTIALFLFFILAQYLCVIFFMNGFRLGEIYRRSIKTESLKLISYLILFYAILNNFQNRKKINRLVFFLFFIGLALSILGITQKISQTKKIFWIYDVIYSDVFFASFRNKNHFANYITLIIFLTMGLLFSRFSILRDHIKGFVNRKSAIDSFIAVFREWIWLYIFGLIIMISSLFFSLSRAGIFAFLCGVVLFLALILLKGSSKKIYLMVFFIFVFIFVILIWINALGQIAQKFSWAISQAAQAKTLPEKLFAGGRLDMANSAIKLIKTYPFFGVGFGAFEFIYNKSFNPRLMSADGYTYYYISHLNNDFLELFCGVGFIGFAIFSITVFIYFSMLLKAILKRHDQFVINMVAGAIAGLFSTCVHTFFNFDFHVVSNATLFFAISGLALVICNSQLGTQKDINTLPKTTCIAIRKTPVKFLILIILIGVFFYVGWVIIKPYLAYRISEDKKIDISKLNKAISLDPSNDRYHYLVARLYIEAADINKEKRAEYIENAVKETKEAILLNPWNERYPEFLNWITKTFTT